MAKLIGLGLMVVLLVGLAGITSADIVDGVCIPDSGLGDGNNFCGGYVPVDLDGDGYTVDDGDCNDGNAAVNPGATEVCGNWVDENCDGFDEACITECFDDLMCGAPVCSGGLNYCIGNDVYQDYDVGVCNNPGEVDAYCSVSVEPWFIESCDYECFFGVCIDGPCVEDVVNGSWSEWENVSGCVDGFVDQVRTRVEYDANACGDFVDVVHEEMRVLNCSVVECSIDSDCSSDYYGDLYCSGDDVYRILHDFGCVARGCVENVSEVFVESCDYGCDDGVCEEDDDDSRYILFRRNGDDDDESIVFESGDVVLSESIKIGVLNDGVAYDEKDDGFDWRLVVFVLLIIGILILLGLILSVLRG
jgi:hypothetical protein